MTGAYRIRAATVRDLPIVLNHRRLMFEEMGFADPERLDAMVLTSAPLIQRGLERGTYHGWLVEATDGDVVAGGGGIFLDFHSHPLEPQSQRAWVVNMFTEPQHRRRGLARRLMETILEWCRAEGMPSLYLHASDGGRPLYESLGFAPTSEMRITL